MTSIQVDRRNFVSGAPLSVKFYGAKGDGTTDDTLSIQAAITAMGTGEGGLLYFPQGNYRVTSAITLPAGLVGWHVFGDGDGSRIIRGASNGAPLFTFASAGADLVNYQDGVISDLMFDGNGLNGDLLAIANSSLVKVQRCKFQNWAGSAYSAVVISGGGATASSSNWVFDCYFVSAYAAYAAISIATGGHDVQISGIVANGSSLVQYGLVCDYTGMIQVENIHLFGFSKNCLRITGGVGAHHFVNCTWGGSTNDLVALDGSGSHHFDFGAAYIFTMCRFQSMTDGAFSHAKLTNAFHVQFVGCSWGMDVGMRYAVEETGTTDYTTIIGGRCEGTFQFSSPILLIGANSRNLALDPQTWTTGQVMSGSTGSGGISAGATVFLGSNAAQATELNTYLVVGRVGSVVKVRIDSSGAAGGGQTFTYTLRKNASDTAVTGTISGGAQTGVTLSGVPITVAAGDFLTIKAVASGGAAVVGHRWSIVIDS